MSKKYGKEVIDYLKSQGRGVIRDEDLKEYDEVVERNGSELVGYECLSHVLKVCRIMLDDSMTIEQRRRKAYDTFNEQDHSGATAIWEISFLRRFCNDGEVVADEISNFKYSPYRESEERRKRLYEIQRTEEQKRVVAKTWIGDNGSKCDIRTTNCPMFYVEFPYRSTIEDCLRMINTVGKVYGLCYGIFNNTPMFSFDTEATFHMRYNDGLTLEEGAQFREALKNGNSAMMGRILDNRTYKWKKWNR